MNLKDIVRAECVRILQLFWEMPTLFISEADFQAELSAGLQGALCRRIGQCAVTANPVTKGFEYTPLMTMRVHREMKIQNQGVIDIIVFREDAPVHLTCERNGPADFIDDVRIEDVACAIEIKAAPSGNSAGRYVSDIQKLLQLGDGNPNMALFFLAIDTSLSVPAARAERIQPVQWPIPEEMFVLDADERPGPCVEAIDINPALGAEVFGTRSRYFYPPHD